MKNRLSKPASSWSSASNTMDSSRRKKRIELNGVLKQYCTKDEREKVREMQTIHIKTRCSLSHFQFLDTSRIHTSDAHA